MTKEQLYDKLLNKFEAGQMIVAIEEMAELIQEITKSLRGKIDTSNMLEEYVDVVIMLEQVKKYYGFTDENIEKVKSEKLKRTEQRLLLDVV